MKRALGILGWLAMAVCCAHAQEKGTLSFVLGDKKIGADSTEKSLAEEFGPKNVKTKELDVGEGEMEIGTAVFPDDPAKEAEVFWQDSKKKPHFIRISGEKSEWKVSNGVALGMTLKQVEELNGKPFKLAGFGWDGGGGLISWEGGKLDLRVGDSPVLVVSFDYAGKSPLTDEEMSQLTGDRELSSADQLMQKLNPQVHMLGINYGDQ